MLIDSHCHLDFDALSADLDGVLARAEAAGVSAMVTISTRVKQWDKVRSIAEAHSQVWCSVGTHPHNAHEELDVTADDLVRLSAHPRCIAIGEVGLDYHYEGVPAAQAASFRQHIAAARETGLPLVIHSRDADDDMAAILREESRAGPFPFILHCFSAGRALAETALSLGGHISFSGILAFPKSEEIRAIAADVPMERLLVETDAPYLAPPPFRGKRNEPAYVRHTAEVLASVKGVDLAEIAEKTSDNFFKLFSKVPDPRNAAA